MSVLVHYYNGLYIEFGCNEEIDCKELIISTFSVLSELAVYRYAYGISNGMTLNNP